MSTAEWWSRVLTTLSTHRRDRNRYIFDRCVPVLMSDGKWIKLGDLDQVEMLEISTLATVIQTVWWDLYPPPVDISGSLTFELNQATSNHRPVDVQIENHRLLVERLEKACRHNAEMLKRHVPDEALDFVSAARTKQPEMLRLLWKRCPGVRGFSLAALKQCLWASPPGGMDSVDSGYASRWKQCILFLRDASGILETRAGDELLNRWTRANMISLAHVL